MAAKLTREIVLGFLSSLVNPEEVTTEGPVVHIGNDTIQESAIAGCDLNELVNILYSLEDDGSIRIVKRLPNPVNEICGFVTTTVILLDESLA